VEDALEAGRRNSASFVENLQGDSMRLTPAPDPQSVSSH